MQRRSSNGVVIGLTLAVFGGQACATEADITSRTRTSASLEYADSCGELTQILRSNLRTEIRVRLEQRRGRMGWIATDEPAMGETTEASANDAGDSSGGNGQNVEYSGTNNQEAGVDEADFFKNDGEHLYLINGSDLVLLAMPTPGELQRAGRIAIEGRPTSMLLHDERVVVVSQIYAHRLPETHPLRSAIGAPQQEGLGHFYGVNTLTKLTVVDTSNPNAPAAIREAYIEGRFQTGRKIDSTIRMVTYAHMHIPGLIHHPEFPEEYYELEPESQRREELARQAVDAAIAQNNATISGLELSAFVPTLLERQGDQLVEHPFTEQDCRNFATAADAMSRGVTSILTLDVLSNELRFEADHIVTNDSVIYASQQQLIVAEPAHETWWFWDNEEYEEATNLHRFDIAQSDATEYTGSGRIDGLILDQFSVSEHDGDIRVAATTGRWNRWWEEEQPQMVNHVYVLRGETSLDVVGHVGDIAKGERIWSSRFVGDQAFLVTFRDIDPLFTIDLSEPTNPTIQGELKVTGVSTYIHPIDATQRLLTVGFGGDNEGLDWSTQVSSFDVSDFTDPTLTDALSLAPPNDQEWSRAWSEAIYEHKAFQYWDDARLLAIPVSTYKYTDSGYEYFSTLELLEIGSNGGLNRYGAIDHSQFYNSAPETWWGLPEIRRSTFVKTGDATYVYAVSGRGVTAHALGDMSQSASLQLDGDENANEYHIMAW